MMKLSSSFFFAIASLVNVGGEVAVPLHGDAVDVGGVSKTVSESLPTDDLLDTYLKDFQTRHVISSLAGKQEGYQLDFGSHQDAIQSKIREFASSESENAVSSSSSRTSTVSLRRNLPEGDFDEFQDMFRRAVIRLPDFVTGDRIGGVDMELRVTNILCKEIILGDMLIDYNKVNRRRLTFEVNIQELDLMCDMDFGWSFGALSGGGQASVRTVDSHASTVLAFTSQNFNRFPPHASYTDSCNADINIVDLEFTGSVTAAILSVFERLISDRVEDEVSKLACDELGSLGTSFLGDALELAREMLATYSEPLEPWRLNPTFPEEILSIPDGVQLVEFNDAQGTGKVLVDGINEANWYFSTWFGRDLGINMFLRQNVLDDNRALTLRVNDLPNFDPVLFEGHDRLTETRITLDRIKVFGLDTFTRFEPVLDIGKHTYQVDLRWESLTVEVDATVHIKPSTREDTLLEDPRPISIFEQIHITFGVDDVNALVAILLAIDQEAFEKLEVGSFLTARNIIPCLLSTIRNIGISGLDVSVGNFREPTLSGFVSRGIDRVVTRSVEAAFLMYESVIIRSMTSFFQTTVRDLATDNLINSAFGSHCDPANVVDETIDFRDLFLGATDAASLGGYGDERYGDVVGDVFSFLRDQFTTADDDGELRINSMIVRPLTKRQSGVDGTVTFFDSKFFSITGDDLLFDSVQELELSLSDARIQNLDTFVAPTEIFQPTEQAQSLMNGINVGSVADRDLNATVTLTINLVGKQQRSTMFSEIDLAVAATSLELTTDILAVISSPKLLHFPLKDITNLYCWLAIMPAPVLDENGKRVQGNNFLDNTGLSFSSFLTSIAALTAVANCRNCTASGGFAILPELMEILDQSQATSVLSDRLGSLVDEMVTSDNVQNYFDRVLHEAPKYCPHSPEYQTETAEPAIIEDILPLSTDAVDTFLFAAATALQMGFVILTESQRLWLTETPSNDLLAKQEEFSAPDGIRLLDWTNFKSFLKIVHPPTPTLGNDNTEPEVLQAAILEQILGGLNGGIWEIQPGDWRYDSAIMNLSIDSVRVGGLNSFTRFELLDAIAPQTLKNSFHLEKLSFELDLSIEAGDEPQQITLSLEVDDINVALPFFIAVDLDLLGSLELGSLFYVDNILPCILSTVYEFDIPEALVTFGHVHTPTIVGLHPDTGNAFSDLTNRVSDNFGNRINAGLSALLQTKVRDIANDALADIVAEAYCPPVSVVDEFIDFRDLLLNSNESLTLGGNGDERYGDFLGTALHVVRNRLMANIDVDGLLAINSLIIRPLTQLQSGVEGMLQYDSEFFSFLAKELPILEKIEFSLANTRIRNLDSLLAPLDILQPTQQNSISNRMNLGPVVGHPLNITVAMVLNLVGEDSPLSIFNEIDMSISAISFELLADIMAVMGSPNLLHFPLRDVLNPHCWLATIPAPEMDENGLRHQGSNRGLSFSSLLTRFLGLKADAFCRNCTVPGNSSSDRGMVLSSALQELMATLNESQSSDIIGDRLSTLLQEVMVSDTIQNVLDHLLVEAPGKCPHTSDLNRTSGNFSEGIGEVMTTIQNMPPLSLSSEAVDTVLFTGVSALQVGFIALTEIHRMWPIESSGDLLPQLEYPIPDGMRLLDWTNVEDSFSPLVNFAFRETRNYLNSWRYTNQQRKLADAVADDIFGGNELGLLSLLNNNILNEMLGTDGYMTIPLKNIKYDVAGLIFEIHGLRISGLNSLTQLSLFEAIAPQMLQNSFRLANASLELDVSLDSTATPDEPPQHVTVSLDIDDISMTIPLFIALDLDLFDSLELGSLLYMKGILPCIASTIYQMHIPEITISVGKLRTPTVTGLMPETQSIATNLTIAMFERFGNDRGIEIGLESLVHNSIRPWINQRISSYIAGSKCHNHLTEETNEDANSSSNNRKLNSFASDNRYVDFRDLLLSEEDALAYGGSGESPYGDLFHWVFNSLQKLVLKVDPDTGLSAINDALVGPLLKSSSDRGTLYFGDDLVNHEVKIDVEEFNAEVGLRLFNAAIQNIDQIGAPLSLFDPIVNEPHQLNNTATAGAADVPLRIMSRLLVEFYHEDGVQLSNDVAVTADFHALTMLATTLLKIGVDKFATFPIRDISNPYCWLATIPSQILNKHGVRIEGLGDSGAGIKHLAASVARLNLNLTCVNCTSPRMEDLAELLSTTAATDDLTAAANDFLRYLAGNVGGNFIQVHVDRLLNDAPRHCPHSPQYEADAQPLYYEPFQRQIPDASISYIILFVSGAAFLLFVVATIALIVRLIVRRRNQKWLLSLPRERFNVLRRQQQFEDQKESELNFLTKSMFKSTTIPLFVRLFIPIVIIGNIAFFLSGHLSRGAEVRLQGQLAGEEFVVENFFEFSMGQSTIDIWQAGGRGLAILILIFSGIWPYTKQLTTLVLWFLPPSTLSISSRGSTLLWLDALAKWSMIDIFTLLVSIVAFRVSILSPVRDFLPDEFYSIQLMVVPKWGLYANLIAQIISQVSSHFIIYYHRRIVTQATKRYNMRRQIVAARSIDTGDTFDDGSTVASDNSSEDGGDSGATTEPAANLSSNTGNRGRNNNGSASSAERKDQLCYHTFTRPHRGEFDRLVVRRYVNYLFCTATLSLIAMLILGCLYPTFALEVLGIVGIAVESGQGFEEARTEYSVFSMVKLIIDQAKLLDTPADYAGLGTLSALCIFSVLVVPLMQTITLAFQWFYPMGKKLRSKICVLVEILQAWQYAEVYIISVLVASWQLAPVSEFMINAYCDSLNDTLAKLKYYGIVDGKDAQCFQVQASIEFATYLILASAVLLTLLNTFVMKAAKQYFRDKDRSNMSSEAYTLAKLSVYNDAVDNNDNTAIESVASTIRPAPVLFTDTFRWLLLREDSPSAPTVSGRRRNHRDAADALNWFTVFENEAAANSSSNQTDRVIVTTTSLDAEGSNAFISDRSEVSVDLGNGSNNNIDHEQPSSDHIRIESGDAANDYASHERNLNLHHHQNNDAEQRTTDSTRDAASAQLRDDKMEQTTTTTTAFDESNMSSSDMNNYDEMKRSFAKQQDDEEQTITEKSLLLDGNSFSRRTSEISSTISGVSEPTISGINNPYSKEDDGTIGNSSLTELYQNEYDDSGGDIDGSQKGFSV